MLPMSPRYTEGDTMRAAAAMAEQGVGCLVTLGGDGTNRAVAVGTNQVPIVAISTGTNNIFPVMVEGTQAGIAAGIVASGRLDCRDTSVVSKTLQVAVNGQPARPGVGGRGDLAGEVCCFPGHLGSGYGV